MRKPVVMVMIDQATRDAFGQLLVVHYLRARGARVIIANQATWIGSWERYRPDVVYISWIGGMMKDILKLRHKPEIALMDQEGGRLGEVAFKRSFFRANDDKADLGRHGSLAFAWGHVHKKWIGELGLLPIEKVLVTGSPRLDPYIDAEPARRRYIGVTLRGDAVTSVPLNFVRNIFEYASLGPEDWFSVGYPQKAQQEDRIWHIAAGMRYIFKILIHVRRHTDTPIVLRPGPWERHDMYEFITEKIKGISIEPTMSQLDYVRNAHVVIDECSSLGLEAILVGTPVVSAQDLIPRLEEHIGGGKDAGLFNAPYKKSYWLPKSVEEAGELIIRAIGSKLPTVPDPGSTAEYLANFHSWPRSRPSSFQIGDALLELAATRVHAHKRHFVTTPQTPPVSSFERLKSILYRHVPGSVYLVKLQMSLRFLFSPDRKHLRKYHYMAMVYPHGKKVRDLFNRLKTRGERGLTSRAAAHRDA